MLSIDVILCVVIEYKIIYHLKEGRYRTQKVGIPKI